MKGLRNLLAFAAGFTVVGCVGTAAAAIWTDGDLSTRLANTSLLSFFVALALGAAAGLMSS